MTQYINLTQSLVTNLPIEDSLYQIADVQIPGLRVLVFPSGIKTYVLYRKVRGMPKKIKIGRVTHVNLAQARKQAIKFNSIISLGGDPTDERREVKAELTFKALCDRYYLDYALPHTKRPNDNMKSLEFHVLPVFGKYKLREITPEKIRKLHADIGENRGKGTANRVLTIVRAVFNFGAKQGLHNMVNPCYGLVRFKEHTRDRFLSKDELNKFFEALLPENRLFQDYFSLLLFTGARKSNVLAMKWADIDFDLKRWRIAAHEAKNNDVNIVYLSDAGLSILQNRKQANDQGKSPSLYVFPGNGTYGHLKDPKKAFQRIKNRMKVQDIRMHDLRRTLASYMAMSGASMPIIGAALNHKDQASTAIYARLAQKPVLDAINVAANAIQHSSLEIAAIHI